MTENETINMRATIEIETPDTDMSAKAVSDKRDRLIRLLEGASGLLREAEEKDNFTENAPIAKVKAVKLARAVNENIYPCDCGKIHGSNQAYAAHKQACDSND